MFNMDLNDVLHVDLGSSQITWDNGVIEKKIKYKPNRLILKVKKFGKLYLTFFYNSYK